MQERYLFRGKRTDNGKWVVGDLVHSVYKINDVCVGQYGNEVGMHEVDPSTICQCTGLKDKNGNLIWENDILDGFTYPYMSDGVHNYYAEVCWFTNALAFGIWIQKYPESKVSGVSTGITEDMEDWNPNDWEVIGNTFDNPELLEE